ncbi:MAG: hypothetical protein AAFY57_02890 [Cyanobacteria bacterium J06642_2]
MSEQKSAESKQKVTLYVSPQLHRRLKISSAAQMESMSALTERAVNFYLEHADLVEGAHGTSHQVHHCPACETAFVLRDGRPQLLPSAGILDDASTAAGVAPFSSEESDDRRRDELVTC